MRKRINNSKGGNDSRPSTESQKTFRRSTDSGRSAGRATSKSRPEAESRFSKPSIKKSSFRPSTGTESSRPNTERPRFDKPGLSKPGFDKPRSFGRDGETRDFNPRERSGREGADKPRFDKPRFDKPRSFGSEGAREFKPRGEFNRDDRRENSDRPRFDRPRTSDREGGSREFRPREEFKSKEGFERPFNRADRDGRDTTPRGDFRPGNKREEFQQRSERSGYDRPHSTERGGDTRREFKGREGASDRPRHEDRGGEPRGFKSREERPYGERTRSEKPDFKKKDSEEPEVKQPSEEGANRRVGRFENAPRYNLAGYEKKSGIKQKQESQEMRLNRYISNAGICSRREADDLIASGQISVNGKVVTEMGYKVMPADVVKYGKKSLNPEKLVYILINKPKDYITTTDDPEERKTVLDLIQGACFERVYPVGRLDRNTTGLLLLTNDGELAVKLTHPSSGIKKIYQAELDKPITTEDFEKLQAGFELEDGFIKPDEVGIVTADAMVVGLEIHSGRNRIVRRIFEHLGYEVQKLDRTVFAGLNKKELPRGKWRFLSEKEVVKLKYLL
jgi:23S rRNA pseudouridine2605 synthase